MATASLRIDLDAIAANWRDLDALSAPGCETGAVVKADSYGLGAARVARRLAQAGARKFFVAAAEEGAAVRQALGEGPEIFVFSGHMAGDTDMIADLALIPMLNSLDQVTRHFETLPGAPFGVQLDTGMNRLGMEAGEWEAAAPIMLGAGPRVLMSHLACADAPDDPMNAAQLAEFRRMTDGLGVARSLSATGGILLGRDYHFDITRPGIGLYGGAPHAAARPVVRLSLPVVQCREVAAGETVGYSCGFTARRDSLIATVAAGYADGLSRALSGKATLYAGATPCPLVGRVSMDLITVDVTDLGEAPQDLDILCPEQGVDALAAVAGTIGYEILTALGARYQRHYVGGGA
ncbi:alanine racemase [Rhodobacter veldkampii DSM 11550]|uniref:Alanine racemase n=1 Tax=Phaeovulum veldkampii DSM 11550 TaxID=1185920 RepID=A0A2T4JK82_9RHOB|nr:alanine racemase [Phaeovulum veldkampii]MBK5945466.1 alanine racemase [Phaeovulum veldkampii DSM 11550]PTE18330.1 alanine racemase [Phaeovulum veldkampii DSM 11550]TDQ57811.1 alanine racemase [Phaeovulum veldkampii DSM 11550]